MLPLSAYGNWDLFSVRPIIFVVCARGFKSLRRRKRRPEPLLVIENAPYDSIRSVGNYRDFRGVRDGLPVWLVGGGRLAGLVGAGGVGGGGRDSQERPSPARRYPGLHPHL